MGFRQYTSCVKPVNFTDLSPNVVGYGYMLGIMGLIVASFAASYNVFTLPILIGLLILLITFLIWWLYGRLICLGGEQCAIGVVRGTHTPPDASKAGDDDFTMDIYLAPGPTDIDAPKEDFWNALQGFLVKENPQVLQIGKKYAQDGSDLRHLKTLHCEFEGSGIRNLLIWANVVLALLVAALALLLAAGPIGAILSVILWIIAAILSVIGVTIALTDPLNPGDPRDISQNLGDLAPGKIVVVKGDWIYDSLHVGWNEIHAVHACQILDASMNPDGSWPADIGMGLGLDTPEKVNDALAFWCDAMTKAQDAEDGGNREDPSQNWVIHPLVDGCETVVIT